MVRTWLIVVTLLICSECLSAQGKASSKNVVARRCGTVQHVDYIDALARQQRSNGELARKYAKLANCDSRYVHHAISVNGLSPSFDNLGFLYAFTNSPKYAAHATVSIVRILGINSDSIQIADHVISMDAVPKEDKVAICRAIAEMAGKSNVLLDDRLFAKNLLRSYETEVAGAACCANDISLMVPGVVENGKLERRTDGSDTDEKIKRAFLLASDSTSCGNTPSLSYGHALKLCGADNRRRARIVVEIAREHPDRVPWALSELSVCGSCEDVPFILEWTNDVRCVANAAYALICIEGVTSNTIACADIAMSKGGAGHGKLYALCSAITRMAKTENGDPSCKALAVSSLKRYSRTIPVTSLWADEFLLSLDPDYETSEDRKALLREVAERRVNDYQVDYATNALKRIDAESLAKHVRMEKLGLPHNVAVKPISNEVEVSREERIKAAFLFASAPRYCGTEAVGSFRRAVDLCGGDSRLISRIVTEIATEHTNRLPWAISVLASHGSSEDVPFLLSYTNDLNFAARAVSAAILIDGITSNAVELANDIMYRNLKREDDRYDICSALACAAKRDDVSSSDKRLSISSLKRYSRTIPATALWADEFLLSLDPDYETSEDRKALLREVADRRVNDYQVDYATNALKRIGAKMQAGTGMSSTTKD